MLMMPPLDYAMPSFMPFRLLPAPLPPCCRTCHACCFYDAAYYCYAAIYFHADAAAMSLDATLTITLRAMLFMFYATAAMLTLRRRR